MAEERVDATPLICNWINGIADGQHRRGVVEGIGIGLEYMEIYRSFDAYARGEDIPEEELEAKYRRAQEIESNMCFMSGREGLKVSATYFYETEMRKKRRETKLSVVDRIILDGS